MPVAMEQWRAEVRAWNKRLSTQRQYNYKPLIFRDGGTRNEVYTKGKIRLLSRETMMALVIQRTQDLHRETRRYTENPPTKLMTKSRNARMTTICLSLLDIC